MLNYFNSSVYKYAIIFVICLQISYIFIITENLVNLLEIIYYTNIILFIVPFILFQFELDYLMTKGKRERLIVGYRTMFVRRDRHLRIPVPEELTKAVLIHAAADGSRPLAPVSSVAAVLSRASYRFLNPPHKVGELRALTAGPFSVPRRCGRTRDSGVLSLASARGLKRA